MQIILSAIIAITCVSTEQVPITPRLDLINGNADNNTYTIFTKQKGDPDPVFVYMLTHTTHICSIGIWRFYPMPNFARDPDQPALTGYQIGTSEKYECTSVTPEFAGLLAATKSYRYLGSSNLNQFSVSVYSEPNAFGREQVFDNLAEFSLITSLPFGVNSYLVTGITDPDAANQLWLAPVVKVYWETDGRPGNQICLAVVNQNVGGGGTAKTFYRKTLTPTGNEPNEIVHFGSFLFLRYPTATGPGFCDEDIQDNMLGMIRLPHPPAEHVKYNRTEKYIVQES
ncbi:uncharacterized protein LOC110856278 isoform X2 [Folsomia candida]|uniref:uncharacterized protein LOC110856278 isoform X2 n=1 Tax=Folsomia candida TaxID=158441 RepID=UPI00160546A0|nr:uncharacterized protein LOC110856278 isoform X2 [Folsomia candida]